jgi:hypothetical protein
MHIALVICPCACANILAYSIVGTRDRLFQTIVCLLRLLQHGTIMEG